MKKQIKRKVAPTKQKKKPEDIWCKAKWRKLFSI